MSTRDPPALETLFTGGRASARRLQKARLVVLDGPDKGKAVDLDRPRVTLGRSTICDLVLTDRAVSGSHAELEVNEAGWVFRDLGSTNGCYLGDVRLREAVLTLGSRVKVGGTTLQVEPGKGVVELPLSLDDRFHDLVGRSVVMRQVFAQLERFAQSDLTLLITGETGTGKELVARAIHRASRRASGPLVVQDCSAMPRDLVESVLFGHERGSFTGATERRTGSFEQAHGGTLFLDEVGELDLGLQPKLLRVLENRELRRVGAEKTLPVDVRVVAATNRDLRHMVSNGAFREDLYYRLGVVTVELPPLRARREDIPLVAQALLDRFVEKNPAITARGFSKDALERLQAQPWPGNVRELRNTLERAAALADGAEILVEDLLPSSPFRTPVSELPLSGSRAAELVSAGDGAAVPEALAAMPFKDAKAKVLEAFEPAYLRALLQKHGGNITRSATAAGLTRYHLRELCKRYGLRSVDNEPE
ncbi:MAG: sigma 54-interacting transcriptional regulator [Deltaproteobacteria bacterium]|nr:sigma 54-interacting transcriptional regulator [Deltaproteobacteria bacterium]